MRERVSCGLIVLINLFIYSVSLVSFVIPSHTAFEKMASTQEIDYDEYQKLVCHFFLKAHRVSITPEVIAFAQEGIFQLNGDLGEWRAPLAKLSYFIAAAQIDIERSNVKLSQILPILLQEFEHDDNRILILEIIKVILTHAREGRARITANRELARDLPYDKDMRGTAELIQIFQALDAVVPPNPK